MLAAFLVCCTQCVLMVVVAVYFLNSKSGAETFFHTFPALGDYVPIVRRLSTIFARQGNAAEFYRAYAIYSSFVTLQIVVFFLLAFLLVKSVGFGRRLGSSSGSAGAGFWLVVLSCCVPALLLFFGDPDLANPGAFSNRVIHGNYFSGYFLFCLLIPAANWGLYFVSALHL